MNNSNSNRCNNINSSNSSNNNNIGPVEIMIGVSCNVFDSYHYFKRVQIRRNYALATRCTAVSGMDLFCEESNEGEIDDLLAFKKVFEDEIQFVEIDVGVKGSLQMHYDNQTLSEVVLLAIRTSTSAPDHSIDYRFRSCGRILARSVTYRPLHSSTQTPNSQRKISAMRRR